VGARTPEFRGSLVELKPGTSYDIQLTLLSSSGAVLLTESLQVSTWSESFPVDPTKLHYLPAASSAELVIADSGAPTGYALYTFDPAQGSAAIDQSGNAPNTTNCITVQASYVIIRGLTLTNCQRQGIALAAGTHDIVIEGNDISGWGGGPGGAIPGPTATIVSGTDADSAVFCDNYTQPPANRVNRVIIQRNRMHDPRYGSVYWAIGHPTGAQAVYFNHCGTNHVIRYNEVYSSQGHFFNDGIGGADNMTYEGFPFADSDIYGNAISEAYDDGIESEGANQNVRIWGNYLNNVFDGIGNVTVSIGPIYVWRNIINNNSGMYNPNLTPDQEQNYRAELIKAGANGSTAIGGRAYYLHNTTLQPRAAGSTLTLGVNVGISRTGGPFYNFVSENNVWNQILTYRPVLQADPSAGPVVADYDLYNGVLAALDPTQYETHGKRFTGNDPIHANLTLPSAANGWSGDFTLAPISLGFGAATVLPNFNDQFAASGANPDMGAHQSGTPPMQFGVNAYLPPKASLSATPSSGFVPLPVSFSAASSSAGSSAIVDYHFDFGDGTSTDGVQPAQSHTYAAVGTYNTTVTLTDLNGLQSAVTAAVTSSWGPLAVALSLAPGGVVMRGERIDISALAADGRPLQSVEFLIGGVSKAVVTAAPFAYRWQSADTAALAAGDYPLLVRATDAFNNTASSAQTLHLLSRTCNVFVDSMSVAQGQTVNVQAQCSAWGGTPIKVEFFVDGALQSTALTSPYVWAMSTGAFAVGSHVVAIRGTFANGQSNHSVVINVLAAAAPQALALIASPSAAVARGETLALAAAASDGRALQSVDFYLDGVFRLTSSGTPLQYVATTAAENPGYHTLFARATDTAGNYLTGATSLYLLSGACNIFVGTHNAFSTGASLSVSTNVVRQGQVVPVQGLCSGTQSVAKMEFYLDDALQSTVNAPPFAWSLDTSSLAAGSHTLKLIGYLAQGTATHAIALEIQP
jgi:PKD repeat protein